MKKRISVEYPTSIKVVTKTLAEAKAMGYKREMSHWVFVNRPQRIKVKQVKHLVQEEFMTSEDYDKELEEMCISQTGMGRAAYQARYKRAWND